MKNLAFVLAIAALSFAASTIYSAEWFLTDDYVVKFTSDNPAGVFTTLEGKIFFDPGALGTSSFDMKIPVESIDTGSKLKNKHARGKKWFDIENHPYITFKSTEILGDGSGGYITKGALQIHGVTKAVEIPFTFNDNTFSGSLTVNRQDYDLGPENGMMAKAAYELLVEISVPVSE